MTNTERDTLENEWTMLSPVQRRNHAPFASQKDLEEKNRGECQDLSRIEKIRCWYDDRSKYWATVKVHPDHRHYAQTPSDEKRWDKLQAELTEDLETAMGIPSTFNAPTVSNTSTSKAKEVPQTAGNQGSLF